MDIPISEPSDCNGLSLLPVINRRHAHSFRFPITVNNEGLSAVGLFTNTDGLVERRIVLCFRVKWMIDSCHAMRMPHINKTVHALFLVS